MYTFNHSRLLVDPRQCLAIPGLGRMLKTWLIAGLIEALLVSGALACRYCNDEIVLTKPLAECLEPIIGNELKKLQESQAPATVITLEGCPGVEATLRGGQELPITLPADADAVPRKATTSFLLDQNGLVCLRELISGADIDWEPAAVFRLSEACRE